MLNKKIQEKYTLPVSRDAARSILCAICSTPYPTRKAIAKNTGLSEVTVGTAFEKIYSSSLASPLIKRPKEGGRSCAHLAFGEEEGLLIIDISSRDFVMSITGLSVENLTSYSYMYSDAVRYEENLTKFMSVGMSFLKSHKKSYCACVLITENAEHPCSVPAYQHMPLPPSRHAVAKNKISQLLGHDPDLVITPDIAVKEYFGYDAPRGDIAYILMGKTLAAYNISSDGRTDVLSPWRLIVDGLPLDKYFSRSGDIKTYYTVIAKLANTLECAFSSKDIFIQSDGLCLSKDNAFEVEKYLRSIYPSKASFHIIPSPCPIHNLGAAYCVRKKFLTDTFAGS